MFEPMSTMSHLRNMLPEGTQFFSRDTRTSYKFGNGSRADWHNGKEWVTSTMSNSELKDMVAKGVLWVV